ncbi:sensor histidine kinase [Actinomadura madurae]|uniref:sensor histidine kinase n=2 Tax=Actinomadura madurae TaxID=1993 RepID=UPI002026A017|nr:sensor histidine kinase [Actinomadura madurae]MCP9950534.1 sensor histidine kinase [Actinomadura madurae]URM96079.1 sensor histidine kinase [Actinomadura madurae]URN06782.1 sensor histidine kinase [Actinomadura madurae]
MSTDDKARTGPDPAGFGPAVAHHAWRLSGRIVAGVGQLLLWILTGIGTLLRPLAVKLGARLNGSAGRRPAPGMPGAPPAPAGATAPLPRWINAWREVAGSWYFAPLTGLALTIAALAELAPRVDTPLSLAGGFAVAATLPLVWRRENLRPVAAVVLSAFAASLLTGQILLVTTGFAALYTLYALGRQLPRQSTGVLAVGSVATIAVVYLAAGTLDDVPWPAPIVAVLAAIGLGDARRVVETAGRTEAEAAERTNETLTRLNTVQREQAVMRERARIARELHDVVAHSVSMIAVQAETAPYTMENLSPEARAGYTEIAKTAREALVEMRRLLSVLRADAKPEPDAANSPQPRLDRLPDLIDQHRGAGGHVDLAVHGDPRDLSATVELSAYRIVQEALTNARRHAPGAGVRVDLTFLPDRLAVRVRDDGASAPTQVLNRQDPGSRTAVLDPAGPTSVDAGRTRLESPESGGGHGLVGMRERATMLGGRFSAGPATEGGFLVEAELPLTREGNSIRGHGSQAPPGR